MNRVFIIGGNHHNTLGVIRSLGICGIKPYVIIQCEEKYPYIRLSKYIEEFMVVKSENEVLCILRDYSSCINSIEKGVLIVCSDNLSSLVDNNYDELAQWYYLPGADCQGHVTRLMDKQVMAELAIKVGFHVPESIAVNTCANKDICIALPWIIKPLVSKDGKKDDIERIYTLKEWTDYCYHHQSLVQLQKLIEKDYEYQLIGLSLKGGEEILIPGLSYVIRPAATTNTGFLHYRPLDNSYKTVLETSTRFLKTTGYSGLFSLEFIRGVDGEDYFMEINFRNDGNAICVTASGVNLPYIWYLYNTGGDYHDLIEKSNMHPVYVMPEFADICLIRQKKLSLISWIKDIMRTDCFMEFDRNDYRPALQLWREYLCRGIKKLI